MATPDPTPKKPGFIRSWGEHIKESTKEPDGKTPSSARIYAGWLIGFVLFLQFTSTVVILIKIMWIDQTNTQAPALVEAYVALLRVMLLWGTLFDVASALSLYGINVWKYVASIANPLAAATSGVAQGVASGLGGYSGYGGYGQGGLLGGLGRPSVITPTPVKPTVTPGTSPVTLHPSIATKQDDDPDEDRT